MPGYTQDEESVRRRLRRIEGQVRGLERLVDDDAYGIPGRLDARRPGVGAVRG